MANEIKGGNTEATATALDTTGKVEVGSPSTITVKFEVSDAALHAKILADAKADDREPNKFLLRFIRASYKAA